MLAARRHSSKNGKIHSSEKGKLKKEGETDAVLLAPPLPTEPPLQSSNSNSVVAGQLTPSKLRQAQSSGTFAVTPPKGEPKRPINLDRRSSKNDGEGRKKSQTRNIEKSLYGKSTLTSFYREMFTDEDEEEEKEKERRQKMAATENAKENSNNNTKRRMTSEDRRMSRECSADDSDSNLQLFSNSTTSRALGSNSRNVSPSSLATNNHRSSKNSNGVVRNSLSNSRQILQPPGEEDNSVTKSTIIRSQSFANCAYSFFDLNGDVTPSDSFFNEEEGKKTAAKELGVRSIASAPNNATQEANKDDTPNQRRLKSRNTTATDSNADGAKQNSNGQPRTDEVQPTQDETKFAPMASMYGVFQRAESVATNNFSEFDDLSEDEFEEKYVKEQLELIERSRRASKDDNNKKTDSKQESTTSTAQSSGAGADVYDLHLARNKKGSTYGVSGFYRTRSLATSMWGRAMKVLNDEPEDEEGEEGANENNGKNTQENQKKPIASGGNGTRQEEPKSAGRQKSYAQAPSMFNLMGATADNETLYSDDDDAEDNNEEEKEEQYAEHPTQTAQRDKNGVVYVEFKHFSQGNPNNHQMNYNGYSNNNNTYSNYDPRNGNMQQKNYAGNYNGNPNGNMYRQPVAPNGPHLHSSPRTQQYMYPVDNQSNNYYNNDGYNGYSNQGNNNNYYNNNNNAMNNTYPNQANVYPVNQDQYSYANQEKAYNEGGEVEDAYTAPTYEQLMQECYRVMQVIRRRARQPLPNIYGPRLPPLRRPPAEYIFNFSLRQVPWVDSPREYALEVNHSSPPAHGYVQGHGKYRRGDSEDDDSTVLSGTESESGDEFQEPNDLLHEAAGANKHKKDKKSRRESSPKSESKKDKKKHHSTHKENDKRKSKDSSEAASANTTGLRSSKDLEGTDIVSRMREKSKNKKLEKQKEKEAKAQKKAEKSKKK